MNISMSTYKLRLNVEFEAKKFILVLTDPNDNIKKLKESIVGKLANSMDISELVIENDKGFQLDADLNEQVQSLLDDKDMVIAKRKGSAPSAPVVPPPVIVPLNLPLPPMPIPKEEQKGGLPPRWEESFKYRLYTKEAGFEKTGSFPLPQDNDVLYDYLAKLMKTLTVPVDNCNICLYHESGAPLSQNFAQQRLIKCKEVITKDQYYYLIVVPSALDPHQPYSLKDPLDGKDEIRYDLKGRQFSVRVDLGVTTVAELKQKIAMVAKVFNLPSR